MGVGSVDPPAGGSRENDAWTVWFDAMRIFQ
jgi:hypothetical protein